MKILIVTNKVKTYALGFQNMIIPLQELGHEIVWAADFSKFIGNREVIPCKVKQISINTNPLNVSNLKAYYQLLDIIEKEKIEAIQCSTPIGGLLARLAGKKKKIAPVIYAAHGFLFFKGAPIINRTLYKLEEIILAHYTDILITITKEDFQAAQKFKIRSGNKPYMVHGAGVNTDVIVDIDKNGKRQEIGIPEDAFLIVSAGELNKNKNNKIVIQAISKMKTQKAYYVVCGVGNEQDNLESLAKRLHIEKRVKFLGYRTDMAEIMSCADVFVMPSFREGMPRAVLEAMDLGLPCIGSRIRGISDLIEDGVSGYLCNPMKEDEFVSALEKMFENEEMRLKMGNINKMRVKDYSSDVVKKEYLSIYREVLK